MATHQSLGRPNTVAHLVAHVERLTAEGIFNSQRTARTIFLHLCCHPDGAVPHPDKQSEWMCPVHGPYYELATIAKLTGISARRVRDALDWLDAEGFIEIDREHKAHGGPILIMSTGRVSDLRRRYEGRFGYGTGRSVPTHPLSPAEGRSVPNQDGASRLEGPNGTGSGRRTVAARWVTSTNGHGPDGHATLKPPLSGKPSMGEGPGPGTRPVGVSGGHEHEEAGHRHTPTSAPTPTATSTTTAGTSLTRPSPRSGREAGPLPTPPSRLLSLMLSYKMVSYMALMASAFCPGQS